LDQFLAINSLREQIRPVENGLKGPSPATGRDAEKPRDFAIN
jgi:hypothetical protein